MGLWKILHRGLRAVERGGGSLNVFFVFCCFDSLNLQDFCLNVVQEQVPQFKAGAYSFYVITILPFFILVKTVLFISQLICVRVLSYELNVASESLLPMFSSFTRR